MTSLPPSYLSNEDSDVFSNILKTFYYIENIFFVQLVHLTQLKDSFNWTINFVCPLIKPKNNIMILWLWISAK